MQSHFFTVVMYSYAIVYIEELYPHISRNKVSKGSLARFFTLPFPVKNVEGYTAYEKVYSRHRKGSQRAFDTQIVCERLSLFKVPLLLS